MEHAKKKTTLNKDSKPKFVNSLKNDDAAEFFAMIISIIITIGVVALIGLIPVNTSTDRFIGILLPHRLVHCFPEPLEMPQYAVAAVLIPVVFLVSYCVLKKFIKKQPPALINYVRFAFLALISEVSLLAFYVTRDGHYYIGVLFKLAFLLLIPVTAVVLLAVVLAEKHNKQKPYSILFFAVMAVIFIYSIYRIATMSFEYQMHKVNFHHFYAVWYPIAKVNAGQTVGVDFNSLYGFYPYLAIPILKLLGGVNQTSASIFITILLVFVAAVYTAFSFKFIKNKVLALMVAAASCLYGPFSILGDHTNSGARLYLQYHPIRSICVAAALLAILIRASVKTKRGGLITDIAVSVVLGLFVFWNIETGALAVIIWSAYRVYRVALEHTVFSKESVKAILTSVMYAAISFIVAVGLISVITYARSGRLLSTKEILFGINAFAGTGFFMIKVAFGIWAALALIFVISLLKTIPYITKYKKADKKLTDNLTGLFAASLTGIGSFTYFMGRSYPTNALLFIPYALLCCGLLYEHFALVKDTVNNKHSHIGFMLLWTRRILCLVVISLVLISCGRNVYNSFTEEFTKYHYPTGSDLHSMTARSEDIKKWADKNNGGKLPNILLDYSIFTSEQLGREPTEIVCEQIDWFYIKNADTYITFINSHPDESFAINAKAVKILKQNFPDKWSDINKQFTRTEKLEGYKYDDYFIYSPK